MDGWSANKTDCDQMTSGLRVTWDKKACRNSTAHLFPLLDDLDGKQQIGATKRPAISAARLCSQMLAPRAMAPRTWSMAGYCDVPAPPARKAAFCAAARASCSR